MPPRKAKSITLKLPLANVLKGLPYYTKRRNCLKYKKKKKKKKNNDSSKKKKKKKKKIKYKAKHKPRKSLFKK